MTPSDQTRLETQLQRLQLRHFKSHYQTAADKAAEQQRSHVDYLAQLVDGETALRESRSIERRIRNARFPVLKTLEDFQWSLPRKINRPQIQNRFRLAFITHPHQGCVDRQRRPRQDASVGRAGPRRLPERTQRALHHRRRHRQHPGRGPGRRKPQARTRPLSQAALLIVDELGYLPVDKQGADLLFQIISQRYERAPMVITTNRAYKHWSQIFNNDSTLTSAILDRVLHHAETVIIEGKSFRMKDEIEE
jgi:DNA replication protein DnaC